MSVAELKLIVRFYKESGNLPVPQTRQALITRFDDINHHCDHQQLPLSLYAPPPAVVVVAAAASSAAPHPVAISATGPTNDPPICDEV